MTSALLLAAFVGFPAGTAAVDRPADLLLAAGRFREAIVEYRSWLTTHPGDAAAHNRLGLCLQKTGQAKPARKEYEKAVDIDRCYAEAWNNLGTLDHLRGKHKRAVTSYRKAVDCKPETAQFHTNLGAAYLDLGDLAQSARSYAEALRLDPFVLDTVSMLEMSVSSADAAKRYFGLAKACASRGELDAALKFLQRARAHGLRDFSQAVAMERAFADLLADPRYAEQLR
jgi:Flp pilus assembly protein TadD